MKCEIIKDLIPLCSEGLCSDESRQAVEEHIKTCEPCRLLYEHIPEPAVQIAPPEESSAMKKLSRKFKANRIKTAVLAVVLLLFVGTVGVLTANQLDRTSPCFSTLFQSIEARKLAKYILKANAGKFIELTLDPDQYNMIASAESWEKIRKNEMVEFRTAYEDVIKDKNFHIDDISSEIYPSENVQGTGLTSFYVHTKITLLADDLSSKYRIELRKNGSDRWTVETVMDDYFTGFDGNPDSDKAAKGLRMNLPFHLPESMASDLVTFRSSVSACRHFDESCREGIAERIESFWKMGYNFKDVKFSELHYDCENERFYYDMTVVGEDGKGTASLDMALYSHSGYSREWQPSPVETWEIRNNGGSEEMVQALFCIFDAENTKK